MKNVVLREREEADFFREFRNNQRLEEVTLTVGANSRIGLQKLFREALALRRVTVSRCGAFAAWQGCKLSQSLRFLTIDHLEPNARDKVLAAVRGKPPYPELRIDGVRVRNFKPEKA